MVEAMCQVNTITVHSYYSWLYLYLLCYYIKVLLRNNSCLVVTTDKKTCPVKKTLINEAMCNEVIFVVCMVQLNIWH
jgi:hypothetical protein